MEGRQCGYQQLQASGSPNSLMLEGQSYPESRGLPFNPSQRRALPARTRSSSFPCLGKCKEQQRVMEGSSALFNFGNHFTHFMHPLCATFLLVTLCLMKSPLSLLVSFPLMHLDRWKPQRRPICGQSVCDVCSRTLLIYDAVCRKAFGLKAGITSNLKGFSAIQKRLRSVSQKKLNV